MQLRAEMQVRSWNEQWARTQSAQKKREAQLKAAYSKETQKNIAAERTREAQKALDALQNLLTDSLEGDHAINFQSLIDDPEFAATKPLAPGAEPTTREPLMGDPGFREQLSFFARIIPPLRKKEKARIAAKFAQARKEWVDLVAERSLQAETATKRYKEKLAAWEETARGRTEAINNWREQYLAGVPESIREYCKFVLGESNYPDSFPAEAAVDYAADSRTLVVDYSLPDVSAVPTLKEVKFIASREALQEVHVSEAWLNRTYDSILFQIALRSVYEIFQADAAKAIDSMVFNGWVNSINKANGKEVNGCILSLHAKKAEFMDINLANVDPKACFKNLKGVSAAKLIALQAVPPILQLNRDDKRFVQAYAVVDGIDSSSNLAAMDWEDFEHLIRELFEKEFSADGSEVKITQASRDGGVDAVVFDPDPIHGGKIVIQAKRYTNTVSVSAVRDLFGTVHNEGANKGILVTTADYGPDAYEFARGKPLTLISGSELLYLLAKHGHKARIDLKEARLLAAEHEKSSRLGNI
jgi:restriction system protein